MEFFVGMLVLAATAIVSLALILGLIYVLERYALLDRYLDWLERVEEKGREARKRKSERKKA